MDSEFMASKRVKSIGAYAFAEVDKIVEQLKKQNINISCCL